MRTMMAGLFGALVICGGALAAESSIDLSGNWRFRRDDADAGVTQRWFATPLGAEQAIRLPGTMDECGLGIVNSKAPNLDDLYRTNVYEGVAWYEREIEVPESWKDKRVTLVLERCRWVTRAWLDGQACGEAEDSLVTPHVHCLGVGLTPGKHRLTIRNDNTKGLELGRFVSALYGGTPGNLNGVVGAIALRATPTVWIEDIQVMGPGSLPATAAVKLRIGNVTGFGGAGVLSWEVDAGGSKAAFQGSTGFGWGVGPWTDVNLPSIMVGTNRWDEFTPNLGSLSMTIKTGKDESDTRQTRFGIRELAVNGTQFTMNGRPIYLRGTLECQVFPLTGYPPCDVPAWQKIYQTIKSYGLNHMRFHSWCPPDAAFAAADIEGVYLQVEIPRANVGVQGSSPADKFTEVELHRILAAYGNHPSFCLMTLGNEYGGNKEVLAKWVQAMIDADPRHLYSSASNAQVTPNRQFTVSPAGRGIHGPKTDHDLRDLVTREGRPLVGHEIAQWTFFPNFDEMPKYTGVMKPANFELVREQLRSRGMLDQANAFFRATGAQATLLYKEEIELLLRTPGYAGFQLLDLHDYPSQGTALIGVLDPFWDSKGFVTPEEHSAYCGQTVPLLRLEKRTFTEGESLTGKVEIAHFGPSALEKARPMWALEDTRQGCLASGELPKCDIPTGCLSALGEIRVALKPSDAPCKLKVRVWLAGMSPGNQWDIWVYPRNQPQPIPDDVVVSHAWDNASRSALAEGKKVLLLPGRRELRKSLPGKFLPVFWSPVWFPSQKPNTMGILCDPAHPLFARFPTEFHSNWQWWDLANNSSALILDDLPGDFRPLVQVIDNFARNHKLGSVFEARVGTGRLLVCAIDIEKNLAERPVARQFAESLRAYMRSGAFAPKHSLDAAALDSLFGGSSAGRMGAKASVDSANGDYPADNAIDGDPDTIWHSEWDPAPAPMPHQLVVQLGKVITVAGIEYTPRQDMTNGRIADFELYVSEDGKAWGTPAARGRWPNSAATQTVRFDKPLSAGYVKLVAKSEVGGNAFAAVAELNILEK